MNEFINEYSHIMSDPAHVAVEFTFVLIDVIIINKIRDWMHGHGKKEES